MPLDGQRRDCVCPRSRHEHGTPAGYRKDKCRAKCCVSAWKRYRHQLGEPSSTVEAVGLRRRLDALATLGWSHTAIGARLGISGEAVRQLRTRSATYPDMIARVTAVYDELWDKPAPQTTTGERIAAHKTAELARRRGYAPPLAWDDETIDDPASKPAGLGPTRFPTRALDEVAVEEALAGRRVPLTKAERAEAVRVATDQRMSAERIAELLGCHERTVVRWRVRAGAAA